MPYFVYISICVWVWGHMIVLLCMKQLEFSSRAYSVVALIINFITRIICMILLNMNYILFFFQEVHLLHFP